MGDGKSSHYVLRRAKNKNGGGFQNFSSPVVPYSKTVLSDWNLHFVQQKDPFTELCIVSEILNEFEMENSKIGIRGYVQSNAYSPMAKIE